jgi:voltage-gated potassium channel
MRIPVSMRVSRRWVGPAVTVSIATLALGAGAAAAFETETVGSYWAGLWWAVSLLTTVGFVGAAPQTVVGALVSVVLMLTGFVLLSLISAGLASLFVHDDEASVQTKGMQADQQMLDSLVAIAARLERLEQALSVRGADEQSRGAGRRPGAHERADGA